MSKTSQSRNRRGMIALEWLLVGTLSILAMVKMLPVFYRHMAGMYNDSSKTLSPSPYDPRNTTSNFTVRSTTKSTTTTVMARQQAYKDPKTGKVDSNKLMDVMKTTTTIDQDTNSRDGWEEVGPLSKSLWDK